jgi:hypothetical protein
MTAANPQKGKGAVKRPKERKIMKLITADKPQRRRKVKYQASQPQEQSPAQSSLAGGFHDVIRKLWPAIERPMPPWPPLGKKVARSINEDATPGDAKSGWPPLPPLGPKKSNRTPSNADGNGNSSLPEGGK